MSVRYTRKCYNAVRTVVGFDRVFAEVAIPAGGTLEAVNGEMQMVSQAAVPFNQAVLAPVRGYLLPVPDLDNAKTVDDLWDAVVPKDKDVSIVAASEQLDFEVISGDSATFSEPGETNINALVEIGTQERVIFGREKLITMASSPVGFIDSATDTYYAADGFRVRSRKQYSVARPTYCMFGIACPAFDDTTTAVRDILNDSEWFFVTYLRYVVMQAWPQLAGLTEAGAESPFADLAVFLEDLTEPTVLEDLASTGFLAQQMNTWSRFVFSVLTPGEPEMSTVSSG